MIVEITKKIISFTNRLVSKKQENTLPEGDNQELSENICGFFYDKIYKIQKDLEGYNNFIPNASDEHELSNFMSVDYIDVAETVRNTKSTTCFRDPCPVRMIKERLNILLPILLRIIYHSLNSGSVSEEWKTSTILLLTKKEASLEFNNYHPINNLSFISKIVEKCIVK